jgi:hypothetical protein
MVPLTPYICIAHQEEDFLSQNCLLQVAIIDRRNQVKKRRNPRMAGKEEEKRTHGPGYSSSPWRRLCTHHQLGWMGS